MENWVSDELRRISSHTHVIYVGLLAWIGRMILPALSDPKDLPFQSTTLPCRDRLVLGIKHKVDMIDSRVPGLQ